MVANVGEILDPEEEEGEGQDGSGFGMKKVGAKDEKK